MNIGNLLISYRMFRVNIGHSRDPTSETRRRPDLAFAENPRVPQSVTAQLAMRVALLCVRGVVYAPSMSGDDMEPTGWWRRRRDEDSPKGGRKA